MQNTHKIGALGLGTIATAVIEGIVSDGHDITVSTRGRANSTRLAGQYDNVTVAENQEVLNRSDIVFLGLTTDVARDTLEPLRFREGQQVITLMAELSLDEAAALVAPAQMTARMLPYPAIATGSGSPILHYGERDLVESLFGSRNRVFTMNSEAELTVYLSAQAVLSPALSLVQGAADWARDHGASDPVMAETFLRTLVGTSLLGSPCAALLAQLDTPGGYNQRLRQNMQDAGQNTDLRDGLDRLFK